MPKNLEINHLKGIFFMHLASLFFAINDTLIKYAVIQIGNYKSMYGVVFARATFTSILIFFLIVIFGKLNFKNIFYDKRSYFRGIFEVMAAFSFLTALILMPMADVYTLLNTMPLIITAVGAIFLKEKVGIKRWSAVIIGFIGVLIVINPTDLKFGYVFILPILAAIFLTLREVATKGYKDASGSLEIIFITSLLVTISFGLVTIFFPINLNLESFIYIFSASIALTLAYLFSVLTIIYAPISLTSSTRYIVIVFGVILGYLFFNEIPTLNMIIGAIIISLSGFFVLSRKKNY